MVRILLAAIFAGVCSGLFVTAIQALKVEPLILQAEVYEVAAVEGVTENAAQTSGAETSGHDHGPDATPGHSHGVVSTDGETPEAGFERRAYTALFNILSGVAFGLLLAGAIVLAGREMSMMEGAIWGGLGFVSFTLLPALGLPPELPGVPAADLGMRQVWWLATVVLTAGGLALICLQSRIVLKAAGALLIAAPHIYGAPRPVDHDSPVPAGLAAEFVVATLVTSALFWIVLGAILGGLMAMWSGRTATNS